MQRIVPHLWFDQEALEAATLYVSLFEKSSINGTQILPDTPSGNAMVVDFTLAGMNFSAISAGPYFKFNPSVSLMVACKDKDDLDRLYAALSPGGKVLMPLDVYPFSPWYAWFEDRFGLSWQLIFDEDPLNTPRIRPCLLFGDGVLGKAEDFMSVCLETFPSAKKGLVSYYGPGEAQAKEAKINYAELNLEGFPLVLMDHGIMDDFTFNEAFSLMINCRNQEEIDYYWDKLSHVPEAEQCGWIKDSFGFSWQIVPADMNEMLFSGTDEEVRRVTEAFLQMKKFDLEKLKEAKLGEV
jgi:predicted 3-demethylubiquinone-9 3-methyltransferase (glyoxalase superfamily)